MDDHLRKINKRNSSQEGQADTHNICSGSFDTIAHIRNELFVFIKTKLWRFSDRGILRFLKSKSGPCNSSYNSIGSEGYPSPGRQLFGFAGDIERDPGEILRDQKECSLAG